MYDYNFFEGYVNKKKGVSRDTAAIITMLFLATVIIGGAIGYTTYQSAKLIAEISVLEMTLASKENQEIIKRIENKTALLNRLKNLGDNLEKSSVVYSERYPIQEYLFEAIVDAIPIDLQVKEISIQNEEMRISGISPVRSAVAEFERSLRQAEIAESINVTGISLVDEEDVKKHYTFEMIINFGGEEDESIR